MVTTGLRIPMRCIRHGAPAAGTRRITFVSKPPLWVYLLLITGLVIPIIVILVIRKRVKAARWPLCAQCLAQRRRSLTMMWVGLGAIPVSMALGSALGDSSDAGFDAVLLLGGIIVLPLAGLIASQYGTYRHLTGGVTQPDGGSVKFPKPHPAFVTELNALHAAAAATAQAAAGPR